MSARPRCAMPESTPSPLPTHVGLRQRVGEGWGEGARDGYEPTAIATNQTESMTDRSTQQASAAEGEGIANDIVTDISGWLPAPAVAVRPVFAIGDVHGRLDLLTALHAAIRANIIRDGLQQAGAEVPLLVHLGDYIDRGPQPLACLQAVLRGAGKAENGDIESIALPGNHEQFLARALTAETHDRLDTLVGVLQSWFAYNCGTAVARELGYADPFEVFAAPDRFIARLRQRLGRDLLDRFAAMPTYLRQGRYLFVHGGLHPGIDMETQFAKPWGEAPSYDGDADPLWVRGPFLTHEGRFQEDVVVVHGHTISREPQLRHNRIGVDTGAFMTGRLTAVELRGDKLRFISAIGAEMPWSH